MKELSKSSIDYYLLPNKIFCGIAGMWPIEEKSSTSNKLFAYFRLIFALTAVSSVFVPEILMIVANWGDIKVLTGVGCVLTTVGQLLFKMFYLLARRKRACSLYNELRDLWNTSNIPAERQSYENFAYWARLLTIVFYSSCLCNVFTFSIAAAFNYIKIEYISNGTNEDLHLPFDVWYGTDISSSPRFEIAFVCQIIASFICAAGISGIDASCMTIILHKFEANLIKCINHHQRMIELVNEVNNLLTPIIFMQILTSGIEICFSGFAVTDNDVGADLIKFISYLTSMGVQLTLWCWPGEILVHESQQVGYMIYSDIPWYNLPTVYQRRLCFMILRSQRHCSITALTFQTLCIHTLTTASVKVLAVPQGKVFNPEIQKIMNLWGYIEHIKVFNTAASYFTLLQQMRQN